MFLMGVVQRTAKVPGESKELVPFRAWLRENPAQFAKDMAAVTGRVTAARAQKAALAVGPVVQSGPDVGAEKAKALIEELLGEFEKEKS